MSEREIITILSGEDPVSISPTAMTHSIVIAEAGKTDIQGRNHSKMVDEIQVEINPNFWSAVALQCAEGKITARNYVALTSTPMRLEVIEPVLKELGVEGDTSVFLRNLTVSLDGGKTEQAIYALIVFRDANPRIIISTKEPLIKEIQQVSAGIAAQPVIESATDKPIAGETKGEPKPAVGVLGWVMSFSALAGGVLCSLGLGYVFDSGAAEGIGFFIGLLLGAIAGGLGYSFVLFLKPLRPVDEEYQSGLKGVAFQKPKRSEANNSARTIKKIEEICRSIDLTIKRKYSNITFSFGSVFDVGLKHPLIMQLDDLLEAFPDDPDILFSKSEVHFANRDEEIGLEFQKKTLEIRGDHFDAGMRKDHPEWVNMCAYPGWYRDMITVPEISLSMQKAGNILQLARDGLKVSLLALFPVYASDLPGKIVDAKWKPVWIHSETGAAFFHYVVFKVQEYDKPAWLEYIINPYPFDVSRSLDGYWLLQRLCRETSVWIAFNDGEKVLYNKRFLFASSERSVLDKMRGDLNKLIRTEESDAKFSSAIQFHQKSFNTDSLLKWW